MFPQTHENIWADVITSGSCIMSFMPTDRHYRYDPTPAPVRIHKCGHCGSNWREDSRGNCKSCGAPE